MIFLHILSLLISGFFFNGRQFISFDGDRSDHHPQFEEFVEAWLAAENARLLQASEAVDESAPPTPGPAGEFDASIAEGTSPAAPLGPPPSKRRPRRLPSTPRRDGAVSTEPK